MLLLLNVQNSSAQYTRLFKGQPSPYDTAVAIRIDIYRIETKKLKYGKTLIDSLSLNIESVNKELHLSDSLVTIQHRELKRLSSVLHGKDSINQNLFKLNTVSTSIAKKALEKKDWHKDPKTWGLILLLTIMVIKN